MADSHGSESHAGPSLQLYLTIAAALAVFTVASFVANFAANPDRHWISKTTSFTIILGVAVCKAVLVGAFFMHLKFEWGKLYFMIVPALILGVMMMLVLLPDAVIAWH
jgi:cytochrome c oxidase subunit 4